MFLKKLVCLIPGKHLTYKFTIPNIKYEKIKNDMKTPKLITKWSFKHMRFN